MRVGIDPATTTTLNYPFKDSEELLFGPAIKKNSTLEIGSSVSE